MNTLTQVEINLASQLKNCTKAYELMVIERDKYKDYFMSINAEYQAQGHWAWQGDGTDDLESLTCPVLISANDLRNLIQKGQEPLKKELKNLREISLVIRNKLFNILGCFADMHDVSEEITTIQNFDNLVNSTESAL